MTSRKYPLPDDERLSERVKIRVTKDDKEALRKAAEFYQYDDISAFVRALLKQWVKNAESGSGVEEAVLSALSATAEDMAKRLDVDVKIEPVFETYDFEALNIDK